MRYLSVCSGIEAASVAWATLGWHPVAFSEIEAFPSAVLAERHPGVPNWGDMTKFKDWPDATIDVFVGGTPCQSFSVAGLRKGLADTRGNLVLTYPSPKAGPSVVSPIPNASGYRVSQTATPPSPIATSQPQTAPDTRLSATRWPST